MNSFRLWRRATFAITWCGCASTTAQLVRLISPASSAAKCSSRSRTWRSSRRFASTPSYTRSNGADFAPEFLYERVRSHAAA
jgi:hypothetical protein